MQAILVEQFGGPEVLTLKEVPDPAPGPGEVLVRIRAAGVNPVETYIRAGAYGSLPSLPYVPGHDGAGEVVATGDGVSRVRPGDRVYLDGAHTYATLAVAPESAVWPLPEGVSFAEGAAIGIPYATAFRALFLLGGVKPGEWVLVHGASGAVGLAALQFGRFHGLTMIGTAGTEAGRKLIEDQGYAAFGHADWEAMRAATGGHGFDLILEVAAHLSLGQDLPALAHGGRVVIIGSRGPVEINPRDLMSREAKVMGLMQGFNSPGERRTIHEDIGRGFRAGAIRPVIAREYPLSEAAAAHAAVLKPGALGKIVLVP
jgi:NADPH2:quinone reductase